MISIGIDICNVKRFDRLKENRAFLKRVFAESELEICLKRKRISECLAVRFAAKEAFVKAIGTGIRDGIKLREIVIRKNEIEFFKKSIKIGAVFALLSSILVAGVGDFHAKEVSHTQPTKLAAMESLWETKKDAPMYLLLIPDPANERNSVEALGIPSMLSILAGQKEIKGLKEFPPTERPPVTPTFLSFRLMVGLGFVFILLSLWVLVKFKTLENRRILLRLLLWSIPLPYIAAQLGWIVAEVGRQPWIVYGLLKTADAVSKAVEPSQVLSSLIVFTLFYGALGIIDIYLLAKYARKGPEPKEV